MVRFVRTPQFEAIIVSGKTALISLITLNTCANLPDCYLPYGTIMELRKPYFLKFK